jgi:ADP-heptose:LPS heptosyltransferase
VRDVRRRRFDLVIDLRSFWETNLLAYFSGAPALLFANRGGRSLDLLATIQTAREDRTKHLTERYLTALAPLRISVRSTAPHLPTRRADDEAIAAMLLQQNVLRDQPLVGFFPGAGHPGRRWPVEHFAELASHLKSGEGVRPLLILGPEERPIVARTRSIFPTGTVIFDVTLTISQLASVAARLTLLVSNDTGPMHVAAAMGTPTVAIGIRYPELASYAPIAENHIMIAGSTITEITVSEVYAAARKQLLLHATHTR